MTCMGDYEIKPPICEKSTKKKKCIHTNGKLENELMYFTNIFSLMWHMPPLHTQNVNHEIDTLELYIYNLLSLPMIKSMYHIIIAPLKTRCLDETCKLDTTSTSIVNLLKAPFCILSIFTSENLINFLNAHTSGKQPLPYITYVR